MPKSVELESRLSRLEIIVRNLEEENAVLRKRVVALQAEVDHLSARKHERT